MVAFVLRVLSGLKESAGYEPSPARECRFAHVSKGSLYGITAGYAQTSDKFSLYGISGYMTVADSHAGVPEPGTLLYFLSAGLSRVIHYRRKQRLQPMIKVG